MMMMMMMMMILLTPPSVSLYHYVTCADALVPSLSSVLDTIIRRTNNLIIWYIVVVVVVVVVHYYITHSNNQQQQRRWWPQSTQLQTHVLNAHCIVICEADKPNCVGIILPNRNIISWFVVGCRWWWWAVVIPLSTSTFVMNTAWVGPIGHTALVLY